MLIDTHCHINDREAFPDVARTLDEARAAGVERFIAVGVEPESCRRALELCDKFNDVYAILGWHPNYTANYSPDALPELEEMLEHTKVVALGEIGLDFHWNYASLEDQEQALFDQLELASERNLPVVFHCREAYDRLLSILEDRSTHPYLFHCWMGNAGDANRARQLDCYIGVDGPITYKKNDEFRETIKLFDKERVVLETDSPYLSPEPLRGKPNSPANVALVNRNLAVLWQVTEAEAADITTANANRFFGELV